MATYPRKFPTPKKMIIVPDFVAYHISQGEKINNTTDSRILKNLLNKQADIVTLDTLDSSSNPQDVPFSVYNKTKTGFWWAFVNHTNCDQSISNGSSTQGCRMGFYNGGSIVSETGVFNYNNATKQIVQTTGTTDDDKFSVIKTTSSVEANGVKFIGSPVLGYNFDKKIEVRNLHCGVGYQLPQSANITMKVEIKHKSKIHKAFSGKEYSILYDTKGELTIKAEWEYIPFKDGSPTAGNLNDINNALDLTSETFGSHVPVALVLDPSITDNGHNYLFARITGWTNTQVSPNTWKISAEFTETEGWDRDGD